MAGRKRVGTIFGDGRHTAAIAVVGLGCRYPAADNPVQLWENILARRQQFRPIPDVRLPLSDYQHDDPRTPDATYGRLAAVIDGYEFDWAGRRIPKVTAEATDLAHWLALDTALQMLDDAGYDAARLPRATTQVIIGNTLTGEFTRANTLRGRWPFVRKALRAAAPGSGMPADQLERLEQNLEAVFKSPFAEVNEDTLAGGLANTIAGRISNYLNLNGGCHIVDGACSASLIAIHAGASSLAAGQADFVIAGGVDISLDPFELIGFSKTGALTPSAMRVYDARGNGFIPGEGCGFVGLKRLDDALRDGDKVYAVLDGWGMSSDGRGGITAPSVNGQHLSLLRAYRGAGIEPGTLDFIEGHGTGTRLGDKTELLAIAKTLAQGDGKDRHCGVTSFKSIVGHTKAAAGIGAFIKGVIAVNQRVLPPTAGCEQPHPVFADEGRAIYPLLRGEVRPPQSRLRAGVSAMGFGGINLHVTLTSPDAAPQPQLRGSLDERARMASAQDSELFCFAAHDTAALLGRVKTVREEAIGMAQAELVDLAAHCAQRCAPSLRCRAAVVAATPEELHDRLDALAAELSQSSPAQPRLALARGYAHGHCTEAPRIGFLFPGQGSQQLGMARKLVERHQWARDLVAQADAWTEAAGTPGLTAAIWPNLDRLPFAADRLPLQQALRQTEIAQPAIVLASLLWLRQLGELGLQPSTVLGHSLGELTAFHAAGAFNVRELIELATLRGRCMAAGDNAANDSAPGAMASLACPREQALALLERCADAGYAVLANVNSDEQSVISGEAAAIDAVVALAQAEGLRTQRLPVSNAFHSQLVAGAAQYLREHAPIPPQPAALQRELLSSCDGRVVAADCDLHRHFGEQIVRPVEFVAAATELARRCDLLLEIGPGHVLSQLLPRIAATGGVTCLPVEAEAEADAGLNRALAAAHVHGADLAWDALHARRVTRPYIAAAQRRFIVNPCERPLQAPAAVAPQLQSMGVAATFPPANGSEPIEGALALLQDYLARRGDFLADVIRADLRNLPSVLAAPSVPAPPSAAPIAPPPLPGGAPAATTSLPPQDMPADTAATALELIAQATGFAVETLSLSMRLDEDLNLDSIKAGDVVARIAQRFDLGGAIDPSDFAQRPLAELVARIDALRATMKLPGTSIAPTHAGHEDAWQVLCRVIARMTGFGEDSLQPDMRLVDDLNLDSIKAGGAVAEVISQLGLGGRLDPTERIGARIGEIAEWLQSAHAATAPMPPATAAGPRPSLVADTEEAIGWARAYVLELEADDGHDDNASIDLHGTLIFLQIGDTEHGLAAAMTVHLTAAGAQIVRDEAELAGARVDHCLVVLPRHDAAAHGTRAEDVPALIAPLHRAVEGMQRMDCRSVAFLQFGLGQDARGETPAHTLAGSCAQAFAASVHLEQPGWAVRVLDFDTDARDADIACQVSAALDLQGGYRAQHIDRHGQRWRFVPRVLESAALPPRAIEWSGSDLVLVTGGAKGITAELACAFAREHGVRLILLGSTPLRSGEAASAEIEATLARFDACGLDAHYHACDLGDRAAVVRMVEEVQRRHGAITGIVHGAGSNRPRRTEQVSPAQALQEIRPKLCGLLNLCEAVRAQPPKMIVALGSIIGVTGMPGNAWYAFSNQVLDQALAQFHRHHPGTEVLTLAYSVWSEVGMGARLGSVHRLAQQGVTGIATAEGVERFLELLRGRPPARQVIVAGRLQGLDTWQPDRSALRRPARFLERVTVFEPGVELVARTHLSLERDLYLRDHYYRGVHLFPTVLGLEAMTQAALAVAGHAGEDSYRIEAIRLERPIVVDADRDTEIEIRAWVRPRLRADAPQQIEVGIRTGQSGFRRDHFAAVVVLEALKPAKNTTLPRPREPLAQLDPSTDLYGGLLFQGALFQRLAQVFDLDSDGAQTRIVRHDGDRYFADTLPAALSTGDPAFRDSLLQAAQLSEQGQYLPIGIDRIDIHDRRATRQGSFHVSSRVLARTGDTLVCEVTAYDDDGHIVERLQGYHLKRVHLDPDAPLPEDWRNPGQRDRRLLEAALQRACAAFGLQPPAWAFAFAPELSCMDRTRRRQGELPLFEQAIEAALPEVAQILGNNAPLVRWDEHGKPHLAEPHGSQRGLSLSHDASHCLATCGPLPQGCDIEPITARDEENWRALLGDPRTPLLRQLIDAGDSRDVAGTRLWCALEAARKALGAGSIELQLQGHAGDAVAWTASIGTRTAKVLTFMMTPTRPRPKMLALTVTPRVVAIDARPAAMLPADAIHDDSQLAYSGHGEQGQKYWACRFRVPFKDITSRRRGLGLSTLADWMGGLRELGFASIGPQLVPDFASGDWGMVTNHSEIVMVGDASCLDRIEGRLWSSRVYGKLESSLDMHFDWVRIADDGSESRIAYCEMTTTWVAIKGHGVVEVAPFPPYLGDFIAGMLPTSPLPSAPLQLRRSLPEPLAGLRFAGAPLYSAPSAPRVEPVLERRVFSTSLEESNLVGNIYFSNYYHWQGRLIDGYVHALAPTLFRGQDAGSLQCLRSKVEHLREAMPFDHIEVSMALKQLYGNGLRLHFQYFHRDADGKLSKLAIAEADYVWIGGGEIAITRELPPSIRDGLLAHCAVAVDAA